MITLQTGILEVLIRWSIFAGGTGSVGWIDVVHAIAPSLRSVSGPVFPTVGYGVATTFLHGLSEIYWNVDFLYLLADPEANPLLHTSTHINLDQASLLPLQNNPGLDNLISDLKAAIVLPAWVGDVMKWSGLISLIIGVIAYFISRPGPNRRRGYQMAIAGFVLAIIGIGFSTFTSLLNYVFSG